MATANPVMNPDVYSRAGRADTLGNVMTVQGTVVKTAILLIILGITAAYTWTRTMTAVADPAAAGLSYGLLIVGVIGGLIMALITMFRPQASPYTAPIYAAFEGLVLGAISAIFETMYEGIAIQAVQLTIGVLAVMLLLYGTRIVQATEKFKIGIIAATGAIALVYLFGFILSFFGIGIPYIHGSGPIGIGFSVVVVVIAALNLIIDFDFIEQGAAQQAPKYMEWYGGFSLLVTLIWMYLEILRLLAKLRDSGR